MYLNIYVPKKKIKSCFKVHQFIELFANQSFGSYRQHGGSIVSLPFGFGCTKQIFNRSMVRR